MRYWLTAIVAAALTIAGGWFVLLNQAEGFVRVAPSRTAAAPGGVLPAGGAPPAAGRGWGARRRARRDARGRDAIARVQDLVWTGETSAARAELLRAPEHPGSEVARVALLAETHLQEGDPGAARDVLERAAPPAAGDRRGRAQYAAAHGWGEAVGVQGEVFLRVRPPSPLAAERAMLVGLRYQASLAEDDH